MLSSLTITSMSSWNWHNCQLHLATAAVILTCDQGHGNCYESEKLTKVIIIIITDTFKYPVNTVSEKKNNTIVNLLPAKLYDLGILAHIFSPSMFYCSFCTTYSNIVIMNTIN